MPFLAHLRLAEVARVASWHLLSRAIVLPDAVFEERLRQHHLREPAIGRSGKGHWRHQQPPCVNHVEERNLLLPNLNHRVVECKDIFLPCFQRLLFVGVAHGCKDKRWIIDAERQRRLTHKALSRQKILKKSLLCGGCERNFVFLYLKAQKS